MADEQTIWEKLGIPNPDEEENDENEEYEELAEDAEEDAVEDDKIARKLANRVDDLQKKFDVQELERRKEKFLDAADPIQTDLFKAVSGDIKDVATLDQTITVVLKKAEEMKKRVEELEAEAEAKVAKAYGIKPGRASSSVPEADEWEEMRARARSGDASAAFKLFNSANTSNKVSPFEK